MEIIVYQDGNVFYDDITGNPIYISETQVKDFDTEKAKEVRKEFEKWADSIDLDYTFL